ncbi:MAG TPA: hypothetical protein VGS60_12700, partial [Actinomycetes bacterium]|nr:hypothetical protein [Actinomycetes bacterium]
RRRPVASRVRGRAEGGFTSRCGRSCSLAKRVHVLFHGPLGEDQRVPDRGVALALRDLSQHLPLP